MTSTGTTSLDTRDLEQRVVAMYEQVAREPHEEYHFEIGRPLAERLGYPPGELDAIPAGAIESFAGVGFFFDLAAIAPGDTVVDLGSGSGMDAFLAARKVGDGGRVIGVDMTEAQLEKATRLAAEDGFANVEFRRGRIEQLPLEDACADVVISNGVVNLSPQKQSVFAETARVLRPGGRLALADIVSGVRLPESVTCDAALWAACIGGAMQREDYLAAIEGAGLRVETVRENDAYEFVSERAGNATRKYEVKSVSLLAVKP